MAQTLIKSGPFAGIEASDTFAAAAQSQTPVIYKLPAVKWPDGLAPKLQNLGNYAPGTKITQPVSAEADVLVILYTDQEIMALLEAWTGSSSWTAATKKQWCSYGHNFDSIGKSIRDVDANDALKVGVFGYLSAVKIGDTNVVLYKTELHPKQDGNQLPFVMVIKQLASELSPKLVISTGTAGAIGGTLMTGDVAICTKARFHCHAQYPTFPDINKMSDSAAELVSSAKINAKYVQVAAESLTRLSLPGLQQCYQKLEQLPGYKFVKANTQPPAIYLAGKNNVPGPEPMDIVSADYMTTDDNSDSEGLQKLGIMNDTDDAFSFYAIGLLPASSRPGWVSVRNASEPQVEHAKFPATTTPQEVVNILKSIAGSIYGIYQYCTTLNSAFACWGVIAGM